MAENTSIAVARSQIREWIGNDFQKVPPLFFLELQVVRTIQLGIRIVQRSYRKVGSHVLLRQLQQSTDLVQFCKFHHHLACTEWLGCLPGKERVL